MRADLCGGRSSCGGGGGRSGRIAGSCLASVECGRESGRSGRRSSRSLRRDGIRGLGSPISPFNSLPPSVPPSVFMVFFFLSAGKGVCQNDATKCNCSDYRNEVCFANAARQLLATSAGPHSCWWAARKMTGPTYWTADTSLRVLREWATWRE